MALKDLQNMLNGHGFPCGPADGQLGPATRRGVARFQEAYCGPGGWLEIDGIPGPRTEAAIKWMQDNNALVSYFSVDELRCHGGARCKCGGLAYVKRPLLAALFKLREAVGPVGLADAYRCPVHNAQVGGATHSQHVLGLGADPTNLQIEQVLPVRQFTGIGTPDHRRATHLDVRVGNPANPLIFFDKSTG